MTQETISINIKPEAKEIIEKKNPENRTLKEYNNILFFLI